jgi:integrase
MQEDEFLYKNFINTLKGKNTKDDYTRRLKYFLEFLGVKNRKRYSVLVDPNKDKKMIESDIKSFLTFLREKKGISYISATQYFNAIKQFYYVNSELEFKWKLIKMYLGDEDDDSQIYLGKRLEQRHEGRPYTREEIQRMLKTATDIRSKIIILLMSSSGMRNGTIPELKLGNLVKIEKYGSSDIQN